MAAFSIHLIGQSVSLSIDLDCASVDELAELVGQARFLIGNLTEPDEDGVCRRVMIAANRIQCAIEEG